MSNDEWNSYILSEGRTGIGQLVKFKCHQGDQDEIRAFLESKVRRIDIPITGRKSVPQGSYGTYTRFEVEQHSYAGGGHPGNGGFIEVLEIKNSPDNRCGFIVYNKRQSGYEDFSYFIEWEKLQNALDAFEKYWRSSDPEEIVKSPGFIRQVDCGKLTPWFYAIGDEELVGDYAFPEGLQDDPVFRFGVKCLVYDHNDFPAIKTCMGTRFIERIRENLYGSGKTKSTYRIIFWDDGTYWDESSPKSRHSPHPLRDNELWVLEAMRQFNDLLTGKQTEFTVGLTDGTKFMGKIVSDNSKVYCAEGRYYVKVTFSDGVIREGWVDFIPTPERPNVLECIKQRLKKADKIERIEITDKEVTRKGKKWSGVFFSPPKQ